jgi:protein-S-isoprenylcysteine O-methyltransferase Ste14
MNRSEVGDRIVDMVARSDSPGVWFPPPLLYALAVVGGWLLHRRWPLPIGSARTTITAGAWLLVACWAALAGSAIGLFRRKQTSMITIRPAGALVSSGPYKLTRNPMYVSLALLTLAFALFLNTWWVVVLLVPVLLAVQRFVIVPEERYLRRRFGADYEAYTRRVRRWL